MKKILYVLSGNLSTTPRALQSILRSTVSYSVTILGVNRSQKWSLIDQKQVQEYKLNYEPLSLGRENLFSWLKISFLSKLYYLLSIIFKKSINISSFANNKTHILLWNRLKKETKTYDLIIGHSGSSLVPVWIFAKRHHIPFIFDIEDYYPGELIFANEEKQRREILLKKLLPDAACVTVASPLISERIKILVGEEKLKRIVIINNCFPFSEFDYIPFLNPITGNIKQESSIVHFIWFSQNIAANRGLELVIPKLARMKGFVHLHLVGNLYDDFNHEWIEPNNHFITTYVPMPQQKLNRFICQFDIGLAVEPGKDENNLIAVSNKIWAYLQAGLYILATDTPAQVSFMKEHNKHGMVFEIDRAPRNKTAQNNSSLENALDKIITNIEAIRETKLERFNEASKFSWDIEREKIQNIWQEILKQ